MGKQLQLSIPTPCHESWDLMTPSEKGKFCGSCQKQVVDFSSMSDRQVAEFFKKPSNGSVCGRFMADQLDRAIDIPKKRIPWIKSFFQFALSAFFVSAKATAQGNVKATGLTVYNTSANQKEVPRITLGQLRSTCIKPENKTAKAIINALPSSNKIDPTNELWTISGVVVDENGKNVAGASIRRKGTRTGVSADNHGLFKINVKKGDSLQLTGGFEPVEVPVNQNEFLKIHVNTSIMIGGEIVVGMISPKRKNRANKILKDSTVQSIKNSAILSPLHFNNTLLNVFPNPVPPGSTINISFKELPEGYYSFQLLNLGGQTIKQEEIWIDAEARILNIDLPVVAAGSYFLVLTNKKTGKKYTEKIIVQ